MKKAMNVICGLMMLAMAALFLDVVVPGMYYQIRYVIQRMGFESARLYFDLGWGPIAWYTNICLLVSSIGLAVKGAKLIKK